MLTSLQLRQFVHRGRLHVALLVVVVAVVSLLSGRAAAQNVALDAAAECAVGSVCGIAGGFGNPARVPVGIDGVVVAGPTAPLSPDASAAAPLTLLFFWGVGCPHCEEAKPLVDAIAKEQPDLRVDAIEVRKDPEGRRRFVDTMTELGATAVGIPTFVIGRAYVIGYTKSETDEQVRAMVTDALRSRVSPSSPAPQQSNKVVAIPWFGTVDPSTVSLPGLTLAIGLIDGVNPCAIWVLFVLLGILLHVKTTRRMMLYAGTFVVMSGVVYFVFMTAWAMLFGLVGLSRIVTMILGVALLGMGLINVKDVAWFKKGPSLVIPDKVKPGLFRRMRTIASAASTPAALAGIAMLAGIVNLVELGCTLGLPAIYTRILTLRGLTAVPRLAYIALYNVAYVVPLLIVVAVFIVLKRRLVMTERVARALKAVSGVMLVVFGALFVFAPELLASK